jgi:hypothetical protein
VYSEAEGLMSVFPQKNGTANPAPGEDEKLDVRKPWCTEGRLKSAPSESLYREIQNHAVSPIRLHFDKKTTFVFMGRGI